MEGNRNAADRGQVREAEKKEKRGRDLELLDMRTLLETKQGRRFVWRYLGLCGVFKTSFTGSSETFFNEGKRVIGLTLLNDLNDAMPEAYQMILKEQKEYANV